MSEMKGKRMKDEFDLNSYQVFFLMHRKPQRIGVHKNQTSTSSNSFRFNFSAPRAQFRHFLDSQYIPCK